jgi:hypothetical protein
MALPRGDAVGTSSYHPTDVASETRLQLRSEIKGSDSPVSNGQYRVWTAKVRDLGEARPGVRASSNWSGFI